MTVNSVDRLDRIETAVEHLTAVSVESSNRLSGRIDQLSTDITALKIEQLAVNTRIDAYQKASNQFVNLAFALISAATITIIVSAVLGKI